MVNLKVFRECGKKNFDFYADDSGHVSEFRNFALEKFCSEPRRETDPHKLRVQFDCSFWNARWHSMGQPVFELTHGIADRFLLTDCLNRTWEEIVWPFGAFLIQMPFPNGALIVDNDQGKFEPVKFIFVNKIKIVESDFDSRVLSAFKDVQEPGFFEKPVTQVWFQMWTEGNIEVHQRLGLSPEKTIGKVFEESSLFPESGNMKITSETHQASEAALHILINSMLYLNSFSQASQKNFCLSFSSSKKNYVPLKRVILGKGIQINENIHKAALAYSVRKTQGVTWRLKRRFLVRGHWRHQSYGPKNSERKLIMIEPFWKGPEKAEEALARTFKIT